MTDRTPRTRGKKAPEPSGPAWRESVKLVAVIRELSKTGNVSDALKVAKASRSWVYEKRQTDLEFAAAFDEARRCGKECLEDEAHRRAFKGVEEPVFYQGEEVSRIRKYSDVLLMFLIKQNDPSYRERQQLELSQAGGRPFMFQMQLHPAAVAEQSQGEDR